MSDYQNAAHEIGWDDPISVDGEQFITLEEGDYDFTVTGFERGRFPGSAKIPACNKATLNLTVNTPEGTANVKYDLILWSSLEWKISASSGPSARRKTGRPLCPGGIRWWAPEGEPISSPGSTPTRTERNARRTMWPASMTRRSLSSRALQSRSLPNSPLVLPGRVNFDGAASLSEGSDPGN